MIEDVFKSKADAAENFKRNFSLFVATFFYSGLVSKKMPGTVGSFCASIVCCLLYALDLGRLYMPICLSSFIVGSIVSHVFLFIQKADSSRDPNYIVIDEACGIFLGAAGLYAAGLLSYITLLINFAVFRIFDIRKPFPIRDIESLMKKHTQTAALGIMLDDVLAAAIGTMIQIKVITWLIR